MKNQCLILVVGLVVVGAMRVHRVHGQPPTDAKSFQQGVYLIGAKARDAPDGCGIAVVSPADGKIETVFRRDSGRIYPGGRFSHRGDKLAFCYESDDGHAQILVIDAAGDSLQALDAQGMITAWSPDDRKLALYGQDRPDQPLQSFVIDLSSGKRTNVELPADYVAEDWHPRAATRTAVYMNFRNQLYREIKGDSYPTRQLDLVAENGERSPISRNPSTDNIWSRFSPDGKRIAHYGRRLVGEKPLEYAVVCAADGSRPVEILNFTQYGQGVGLSWFRPTLPPAWSPDGSTLAWSVSTNAEAKADGGEMELVLIRVEGGAPKRISLSDRGIQGGRRCGMAMTGAEQQPQAAKRTTATRPSRRLPVYDEQRNTDRGAKWRGHRPVPAKQVGRRAAFSLG
ncbi:MAG: hypothetical protein RIC55_10180 [Pirellulaceae bacterium]